MNPKSLSFDLLTALPLLHNLISLLFLRQQLRQIPINSLLTDLQHRRQLRDVFVIEYKRFACEARLLYCRFVGYPQRHACIILWENLYIILNQPSPFLPISATSVAPVPATAASNAPDSAPTKSPHPRSLPSCRSAPSLAPP